LPSAVGKIEYYDGKEPLFDAFGIEIEIERALERKVWLKSGGYIVIDQTEALASIDVNTGKFVGSKNQEETVVKTNMEAVREIVYQLRLRNIGGLIIIDFIDMEREENKEKVYSALDEALKYDRSRATILKISEFGLVEMTRKRVRESLARTLTDVCPVCDGRGAVKSATTLIGEVYREIARVAGRNPGRDISCLVTPRVADLLLVEEPEHLMKLETETGAKISIDSSDTLAMESFKVAPKIE
jgi:ribonuclease G